MRRDPTRLPYQILLVGKHHPDVAEQYEYLMTFLPRSWLLLGMLFPKHPLGPQGVQLSGPASWADVQYVQRQYQSQDTIPRYDRTQALSFRRLYAL